MEDIKAQVDATKDSTDNKDEDGMESGSGDAKKITSSSGVWDKWFSIHRHRFPRHYKLVTEKDAVDKSTMAISFAVMCASINSKMLNPNYPLMVSGLDPDSFPDTEPFDFNSATYFLPMMSLLGIAISSIFIGRLSDRIGRKMPMIGLSVISGLGQVGKYYTRGTFWGFSIMQFAVGLFLSILPIAQGYVGDVFSSEKEKQKRLSNLEAGCLVGNSGGGIIAILMGNSGLFAPLWVGAGLMLASAIAIAWWVIEPGDARLQPIGKDHLETQIDDDEEDEVPRPEKIERRTMWLIIAGALADNFGSTSLFPLCLSPLALEQYTISFMQNNQDPIMTYTGYQWLSVCVAFLVVPSTMIIPRIFTKYGVAGTCVFGNTFTGVLTMGLLFIGGYAPATQAAFAGFVVVLYAGFPFTVWSQLTTGPMLDYIAPKDKVGYVQGLNNSAMNFGMAVAPWLFGLLADGTSNEISIWTGIGISFLAACINAPLMFHKGFGPAKKKLPQSERPLPGEDKELVEKAIAGEFVPPDQLWADNRSRFQKGQSLIVPKVKPYEEDRDHLDMLRSHAQETFRFRGDQQQRVLAKLDDPKLDKETKDKDLKEICDLLNKISSCSSSSDPDSSSAKKEMTNSDDLGQWVADYLDDNGYKPHLNSLVIKLMVLSAFPTITREKEFTPENVEDALLRSNQVMNEYLDVDEKKKYTYQKVLGNGGVTGRFYS